MSEDTESTTSKVISIINVLKETLAQLEVSDEIASKLKTFVLLALNRKFKDMESYIRSGFYIRSSI
ncbi:hypothetical protein CBL_07177 [Carabus blaptoides fortunei]